MAAHLKMKQNNTCPANFAMIGIRESAVWETRRFVVLGDAAVGKSSLIKKYIHDVFDPSYSNRGKDLVDFFTKEDHKTHITLEFADVRGDDIEKAKPAVAALSQGSNVAIVVYDVTNAASFENAEKWIELVRENKGADAVIILVGTKCDKGAERQVQSEAGLERSTDFQLAAFAECESVKGNGIDDIFGQLAAPRPGPEEKDDGVFKGKSSTFDRVYGRMDYQEWQAGSMEIGRHFREVNPELERHMRPGPKFVQDRKWQLEFAEKHVQELEAIEAAEFAARNKSTSTTTGEHFTDPSAGIVPPRLEGVNFVTDDAVTFYTEKLQSNDKTDRTNVKASAQTGWKTFGRNAKFSTPTGDAMGGLHKDQDDLDMILGAAARGQ